MARFTVRLTPRAGTDRIDGVDESGALKVHVRTAPVDGAANAALIRMLSDALNVPLSQVEIVNGARTRRKIIEVPDSAGRRLLELWPGLRAEGRTPKQ